jgi:16S rRNA (cytosine967-C5)-methyltransferase
MFIARSGKCYGYCFMQFLLNHIKSIVSAYEGHPPLAIFLKQYFKQYPKLGSRDRKAISEAVFIYYRCAFFYPAGTSVLEVIGEGIQHCGSQNSFLQQVIAGSGSTTGGDKMINSPAFGLPLSAGLSLEKWFRSLWQQPRLFIRTRKNKEDIISLLQTGDIAFEAIDTANDGITDVLSLPNGKAIDQLLPEEDYVVQDWSSQASIKIALQLIRDKGIALPRSIWDVCSGAGGKSILLKDLIPGSELLASDIREPILHNLKMRFRKYRLNGFRTMLADSRDTAVIQRNLGMQRFNMIVCDVPCSGSGTWARTPEQFHFFKEADLARFEQLQYPIAFNAQHYLAEGGIFVYITCSVFAAENEAVLEKLVKNTDLRLMHSQVIDGIENKADCMFLAVFRKAQDKVS